VAVYEMNTRTPASKTIGLNAAAFKAELATGFTITCANTAFDGAGKVPARRTLSGWYALFADGGLCQLDSFASKKLRLLLVSCPHFDLCLVQLHRSFFDFRYHWLQRRVLSGVKEKTGVELEGFRALR
jgi:hypothetical protein